MYVRILNMWEKIQTELCTHLFGIKYLIARTFGPLVPKTTVQTHVNTIQLSDRAGLL